MGNKVTLEMLKQWELRPLLEHTVAKTTVTVLIVETTETDVTVGSQ
jgi:hypothetical protein